MKNNNRLRVAIIGLGAVTHNIHLPAYQSLNSKIEVVAGCDTNAEAREITHKKNTQIELFDDALKMVETTKPDIVSVCTPPSLHVEQCLLALEHNAHVFCEKPLAESLEEVNKLISASERAKRYIVVNNQFPYMKIHQGAKQLIGSPEFGQLLFLQAWQTFHPSKETEANWRGTLKRRLCFEFGIHVFELIRYFFEAEPVLLMAHMPKPKAEYNSDMINLVSLEFADGRAASIILNRISKGPERYLDMRLDGEFASIHTSIGGQVHFAAGIHPRDKRPFIDFNFVKGGQALLQQGNKSKIIAKDGLNPFASSTAHHFGNFIKAIGENKTPPGTIKENRKTIGLVFAAYDSAETQCSINLIDYLNGKSGG